MRSPLLLLACAGCLLFAGCPSYTSMAGGTQQRIREIRDGQLLWLKQSMYAGPFWDDDRYRLLSPFPFDRVEAVLSPEGEPLLPPSHDSIVPAGTRVRVERVVFPTGDAVFRRPLYSPRYATWVYLRVAKTRGDTRLEHEQRHVLLLPAHIVDIEGFNAWFDAALTTSDPNPWIRSLEPSQRLGIDQKRAVVGMSYEALAAALGAPDRLEKRPRSSPGRHTTIEVATFGPLTVTLEDGVVILVDDPMRPRPSGTGDVAPQPHRLEGNSGERSAPPDALENGGEDNSNEDPGAVPQESGEAISDASTAGADEGRGEQDVVDIGVSDVAVDRVEPDRVNDVDAGGSAAPDDAGDAIPSEP